MPSFENCTGYLVTENHQWVPAVNTGTISETSTAMGAEFVSAMGERTFFARGTAPRQWQVTAKAPWAWAKNLKALERAGARRLYWLSPLGVHTNILPHSRPANSTSIGIRIVAGQAVEMFIPAFEYAASADIPVMEGQTLTCQGVQAGGTFSIEYLDAAGGRFRIRDSTSAGAKESWVSVTSTVPKGAVMARIITRGANLAGGLSIRAETHGLSVASESSCAWVTLHDVEISHGNIAFEHSPIDVSFTLKEVT